MAEFEAAIGSVSLSLSESVPMYFSASLFRFKPRKARAAITETPAADRMATTADLVGWEVLPNVVGVMLASDSPAPSLSLTSITPTEGRSSVKVISFAKINISEFRRALISPSSPSQTTNWAYAMWHASAVAALGTQVSATERDKVNKSIAQ